MHIKAFIEMHILISTIIYSIGVVEPVQNSKFNSGGNISSAGHTTEGIQMTMYMNFSS
jgi:hypothetical protein